MAIHLQWDLWKEIYIDRESHYTKTPHNIVWSLFNYVIKVSSYQTLQFTWPKIHGHRPLLLNEFCFYNVCVFNWWDSTRELLFNWWGEMKSSANNPDHSDPLSPNVFFVVFPSLVTWIISHFLSRLWERAKEFISTILWSYNYFGKREQIQTNSASS